MDRSLLWDDDALVVVDQTLLPDRLEHLRLTSPEEVAGAIRRLAVRGAPAIGLAGAFAVALSARRHDRAGVVDQEAVRRDAAQVVAARPTAVNLSWAVDIVLRRLPEGADAVRDEALGLLAGDEAVNRAAAARAADALLALTDRRPLRVLTHCNTGALATGGWGTAFGALRVLHERGLLESVLATETRPLLQGARLTVFELAAAGIPHRLCVDGAAPAAIASGLVDAVVVGADRISGGGDVANKIGTYSLALAAAAGGIPLVVVAPESTIDESLRDGRQIVIEERAADEVLGISFRGGGAPAGTSVHNPAFDVTPAHLVTVIATDQRTLTPSDRGDLIRVSRELHARGWLDGTSGNLSTRSPGGNFLITASGRSKGELTTADFVTVSPDGTPGHAGPGRRASAETPLHTAIYQKRPGAGAVVHAHSPAATTVSMLAADDDAEFVEFHDLELIKGLIGPHGRSLRVPVLANWADVGRIADDLRVVLDAEQIAPVVLIARHGATAWGADLASARNHLECLEAICGLYLGTRSVPTVRTPDTVRTGAPS